MKLLEVNSIAILAGIDEEIKTWNQNMTQIEKHREDCIEKISELIKGAETVMNKPLQIIELKPEQNLKRLNLEKSKKTIRKLLFGHQLYQTDFEWTLESKITEKKAE